MTPEIIARIAILRQRAIEGTMTMDDRREAVEILRAGRLSAAATTKPKTAKAKAVIPHADDLLKELEGL